MSQVSNKSSKAALVVAMVALLFSMVANYKQYKMMEGYENIKKQMQSSEYLEQHSEAFNKYIDGRIDKYVQREQRQRVEAKYDAYKNAAEETKSGKYIYGAEDARFTLVEYSDIECPYCKKFHKTPKKLVDDSKGNVNWEFKHFPLEFHNPMALIEGTAAECAGELGGNKSFWVYLDSLFAETKGNGQGAGDLVQLAEDIGLDGAKFSQCLNEGKYRDKVMADMKHGASVGVNSTPITFIVDNHTGKNVLMRGAQNGNAIMASITKMLKESGDLAGEGN